MKKRIALAASIALAISVGGMLPASAAKLTAPVVTASSCARAGGTLEIQLLGGDITVDLAGAYLSVDITGTSDAEDECTSDEKALSGLTSVIIKAADNAGGSGSGDVSITLADSTTAINNFGSIPMTIRADGMLEFDGSGLTGTTLKPFVGSITEETFTIGSVTGSYYAGELDFVGGNGNDSIDASAVTTTDFVADGGVGADTLKGGAGDDTLAGSAGADVLYGNAGDDGLDVSDGATSCNDPKSSNPKAYKCSSATGGGIDEGWGGLGDDTIDADKADTVAPGDGQDVLVGFAYQLAYGDSSAAVSLNLTTANGVVRSTAGDDFFDVGAVAQFLGSEFDDTMVGNTGENAFFGGAGADQLVGGLKGTVDGADTLSGEGGADKIKGGSGDDLIFGDTGADLINGGTGNDTVEGGGGDDVIYGSAGDDILRGNKGSDQTWGGKGTFDVCAAEVTDSCEFKK